MPDRETEARIDGLYQLPLDEFTSARNALAKELGKEGAGVKTLTKPPAAAWAINQVFWQRRPVHDALVAAATGVRSAHAAVMAGQRADLRAAGAAHDEAIEAALKAALDVLARAGQPASDATKQAVATTLRALPTAAEPAGRLSRTLQPGGFEMLAGLPAGGTAVAFPPRAKPAPATVGGSGAAGKTAGHAPGQTKKRGEVETREEAAARRKEEAERNKAIASAREAVAAAAKAERAAEQEARRAEFDAAKSARDVERAQAQRDAAQAALEAAQTAADEAEAELTEATRKRDGDARRGREHAAALAKARVKLEAAQAELARLTE